MINAINFIDGIHGFASENVIISIGIFLIASNVGEERIAIIALIAFASLGLFFTTIHQVEFFWGMLVHTIRFYNSMAINYIIV